MRKNEPFVVTGAGAAILNAEFRFRGVPGMKSPNQRKMETITWDEATEDERENGLWFSGPFGNEKKMFKRHSEEELKQIEEDTKTWMQAKLNFMFNYILEHYNYEYAKFFYDCDSWHEKFIKYDVKIDFNTIPHCKYSKDGQCDLFCPFISKKGCTYSE